MTDVRPGNQRSVRNGGLMRCCLATLSKIEDATFRGQVVPCMYEPHGHMVVAADGVWEWQR